MVRANFQSYGTYVTDSLYQWEKNRKLEIRGVPISVSPEILFTNSAMGKSIPIQGSLSGGVITVDIPNSILQYPLPVKVYIGVYNGAEFKILEKVEIPIIPCNRPDDYVIDTGAEVYSFKSLENAIAQMATKNQVANIITHNNDTEGNTELVDIRADADGNTHSSAGEAVRYVGETLKILAKINPEWIYGCYINFESGNVSPHSDYMCTDFIERKFNLDIHYKVYIGSAAGIAIYNENKEYIGGVSGSGWTSGVITTGRYVRFTSSASVAPVLYWEDLSKIKLWKDSVGTEEIKNKAITLDKIAFVERVDGTNYINRESISNDSFINGAVDGAKKVFEGLYATDYIPLIAGNSYYYSDVINGYYAFYDADKNYISGAGNDNSLKNPFIVPENACYGRFTIQNAAVCESAWINDEDHIPKEYAIQFKNVYSSKNLISNPCDYDGNEISVFNKCLCIGDSMTSGTFNYRDAEGGTGNYVGYSKYCYPTYLSKLTGIETINLGSGGSTSAEWYEKYSDDDLSGFDLAIIQLGINDAIRYGAWTETSIRAFENIITKLKNENANIKIFVATIIPARSYQSAALKLISEGIRTLINSLNDKNVILVDIEEYGHTNDSKAYNCGHLSALGYYQLAKDYKSFISWYISKNKEEFSEIQFIGTEYIYADS